MTLGWKCLICGAALVDPRGPCACEALTCRPRPPKRKTTIEPVDPFIAAYSEDLYQAAQDLYYLGLTTDAQRENEYVQRLYEVLRKIASHSEGYGDENY